MLIINNKWNRLLISLSLTAYTATLLVVSNTQTAICLEKNSHTQSQNRMKMSTNTKNFLISRNLMKSLH